jgi:hypothetical protein
MSAYYRQYSTYLDITTPSVPVLWVCITAGDKTSSVWAKISGGGSAGNWNDRGAWSATPASPYMTYDVVQMGSGTSSGMYISQIDNNTSAPDSGYGWRQVSSSTGTWL